MFKIFVFLIFCILRLGAETNATMETKNLLSSQENLEHNRSEIKEEIKVIIGSKMQDEQNQTQFLDIVADKIITSQTKSDISTDSSLINTVKEIEEINAKIILLSKNADNNITSQELRNLQNSKKKLLENMPFAITQQNIDIDFIMQYLDYKNALQKDLAKAKKNTQKYANLSIKSTNLQLNELFFTSLIKLESMFVKGSSKKAVENDLKETLLNIQMIDIAPLFELGANLKDSENFKTELAKLQNIKSSYEEILTYLLENKEFLTTNIIFGGINFKLIIDYINSKFHSNSINFGKIILIAFLMIIFISVRKFLARIIYFVFRLFSKSQNIDNRAIKTQVIDIIATPMGALMTAYALQICSNIFFYPAPIPIKLANAFSMAYIALYAWLIIKILDGYGIILIGNITKKNTRKDIINLIIKFLYIIIIIIAFLLVLRRLGFNVSGIVASLGIGGLAVALATKDIIANFFASVMLLFDNSFSQGDLITIDGVEGNVVEIGLRKTTIRTADNALVFIPNSTIMAQNVKNWNRRKVGRQLKLIVGVNYSAKIEPLKSCIDEIKQLLNNHPDIATPKDTGLNSSDLRLKYKQNVVSIDDLLGYKSAMYVALDNLGNSAIEIAISCFTKPTDMANYSRIKEEILFGIMQIVEDNGLSLAFPSQSIYIEKMPK